MRESSSLAAPPVRAAAGSHVGRVRETNEDRVFADPDRGSFAVIDGVGGQAAGEHAAQTALDTIRQRLQIQIGTPAERVREAIALANDQIRQQALLHPDRRGMACVLTLVLLQAGQLTAGHVGDTRLYKMRGGTLRKLTHDHSPIGEREDRGELSESEAMRHPRRNEVYREVGLEPRGPDTENFIDIVEEPFEPDAALLLCSDGLSDVLSSAAISEVIHRYAGDPPTVVDQLIAQANDAGGKDNISVVYIEGTQFARSMRRGPAVKMPPRAVNGTRVLGATVSAAGPAIGASGALPGAPSSTASAGSAAAVAGATPQVTMNEAAVTTAANPAAAAARGGRAVAGMSVGRLVTFVAGLLVGAAIALGAAWLMRDRWLPAAATAGPTGPLPRTLTVGSAAGNGYRTIGQAMAEARAGDTIQIGPGEYREQVVVTDGVALVAVPAREAVLRAPAQALPPWTAVIIPGDRLGSRVSGLRIAGDAQSRIAIGLHVLGRAAIDDVEVTGTMLAGIAQAEGTMSVMGAALHDNAGPGLLLNGGEARIAHSVFARNGGAVPQGVDVVLNGPARAAFAGNVITGDPQQRVRGLAADQAVRFREANLVLPVRAGAATPARPPAPRPPAAAPRRAAAAPATNR